MDIFEAIIARDDAAVQLALADDPDAVNQEDDEHRKPLHVAAVMGLSNIVEILLNAKADINAKIIPSFYYSDSDKKDTEKSPLHLATCHGHFAVARLLLDRGAAVDAADYNGNTPLHDAVRQGHNALVTLLLDRKASANASNRSRQTPVHIAAVNGRKVALDRLLAHGGQVNVEGYGDCYPIHLAAKYGHVAVTQKLLEHGARVNLKLLCSDETPLHFAARGGHHKTVQLLLQHGAKVNVFNEDGKTPLHSAAEAKSKAGKGLPHIVAALLEKREGIEDTEVDAVTAHGRFNPYYTSLFAPPHVQTALHVAAAAGHSAVVAKLLERGANIEEQDYERRTALHHATISGDEKTLRVLLQRGARVDTKNYQRQTPLHFAAQWKHAEAAAVLLEYHAAVNAWDYQGDMPLHFAMRGWGGTRELMAILLRHGARVSDRDEKGMTPLHLAVNDENAWAVEKVLAALDEEVQQITADMPDREAELTRYVDEILNARNQQGDTVLHVACAKKPSRSKNRILQLLLARNRDVNCLNTNEDTPLNKMAAAAGAGCIQAMQVLLARGARVTVANKQGDTPLHWAVRNRHKKMALLLMAHGAEANCLNGKNPPESPLSIAEQTCPRLYAQMQVQMHRIEIRRLKQALQTARQALQAVVHPKRVRPVLYRYEAVNSPTPSSAEETEQAAEAADLTLHPALTSFSPD